MKKLFNLLPVVAVALAVGLVGCDKKDEVEVKSTQENLKTDPKNSTPEQQTSQDSKEIKKTVSNKDGITTDMNQAAEEAEAKLKEAKAKAKEVDTKLKEAQNKLKEAETKAPEAPKTGASTGLSNKPSRR